MSTLRAYLALVRVPAVFTSLADVMMGWAIVVYCSYNNVFLSLGFVGGQQALVSRNPLPDSAAAPLAGAMLASAGLYLAGMAFNDYFDREEDARDRPFRPIPSGRVSATGARSAGVGLMIIGIVSGFPTNVECGIIAMITAGAVLLYDRFAKRGVNGPVVMGVCRALNVMIGASAAGGLMAIKAPPVIWVCGTHGFYIAGVTLFALREEAESSRAGLIFGGLVAAFGLAGHWAYPAMPGSSRWPTAGVLLLVILFTLVRRSVPAVRDPSPERVQGTVRLMLLSVITIDASVAYAAAGRDWGLATAALMIPALFLGRMRIT